jgi:hypothetical protein
MEAPACTMPIASDQGGRIRRAEITVVRPAGTFVEVRHTTVSGFAECPTKRNNFTCGKRRRVFRCGVSGPRPRGGNLWAPGALLSWTDRIADGSGCERRPIDHDHNQVSRKINTTPAMPMLMMATIYQLFV